MMLSRQEEQSVDHALFCIAWKMLIFHQLEEIEDAERQTFLWLGYSRRPFDLDHGY